MMCDLEQIGSSLQAKQMRKLKHLWYLEIRFTGSTYSFFFFVTKSEESKGFLNTYHAKVRDPY